MRTGIHTTAARLSAVGCALGTAVLSCTGPTEAAHAPVSTVTVSPPSTRITLGSTAPLRATVEDAKGGVLNDREIFWTSSDTTVAPVSSEGVVSALRLGTARIVASSEGEFGIATITVMPPPVASVAVAPTDARMTVGSTQQFQSLTYDAAGHVLTGRTVAWSSSDQQVATVDDAGRVRAISSGTATISATSEGKTGSARVTVIMPVDHVEVRPTVAIVGRGRTRQLSASTFDAEGNELTGRTVTWTTSNPDVATVDAAGLVTGVRSGSAVITATAEGKHATATILVSGLVVGLRTVQP